MAGFRVLGGETINGAVALDAAKNAVLPILAASILPEGDVTLRRCPDIRDVHAMAQILRRNSGMLSRLMVKPAANSWPP